MRMPFTFISLALSGTLLLSCATGAHECTPTCCPKCCEVQAREGIPVPAREGRDIDGWAELARTADGENRQAALESLAAFGPVCYCRAVAMLDSEDSGLRYTGVETLRRLGSEAKPAASRLGQALTDRSPLVRAGAAKALGTLGKEGSGEIPALTEALNDDEWEVRYEAVIALGGMGWRAYNLRAELWDLGHRDPDARVRTMALEARDKIYEDWYLHSRGVH
jgi:HEAT repeat protein